MHKAEPYATSRQEPPTVDDQGLAGQIRSAIGGQQERNFGNFVRLAEMLDGLRVDDLAQFLLVLPEVLAEHGPDQAGSDGIDAHAFGPELQGVGLRHHDERGLGHAVEHAVELRPQPGNGRDVDNRSGAALAHARGHRLNETEGALQVDLDHLVELGFIDLQYGFLSDIGGRVVDQDIDPAELAMRGIDELPDVRGAAYMTGERVDPASAILHFSGSLEEGLRLASADHDGGAFTGEQFGDGAPDATAGASDDGNLFCRSEEQTP